MDEADEDMLSVEANEEGRAKMTTKIMTMCDIGEGSPTKMLLMITRGT